jgi:hypothetical protein
MKINVIDFLNQLQIFPPAAKMNDGKKNQKAPLVPQQTYQHYCHKYCGSQCSCSECFPVKSHL